MLWKIPPEIKVLEALGAISDGRVFVDGDFARVKSSNLDKEYVVRFFPEDKRIYSTDNASKFHHYLGYPIVAFLMKKGFLSFDKHISNCLKGINWHELNRRFKRNYFLTEAYALKKCESRGVKKEEVKKFLGKVLNELARLKLKY